MSSSLGIYDGYRIDQPVAMAIDPGDILFRLVELGALEIEDASALQVVSVSS
jgi:hypothetical protein